MFDSNSHCCVLSETQSASRYLVEQAGCQFGWLAPGICIARNNLVDMIDNGVKAAYPKAWDAQLPRPGNLRPMGLTIVIGDIHGCFDELTDLLNLIELNKVDRVVTVGDLIVKGEKNREVLDLFIDDQRFSSVIGNHDRKLRQVWRGEPVRLTKAQKAARAELEVDRERYSAFLQSLPF